MNETDLDLYFEKCYEQYFMLNPVIKEAQIVDCLHLETANDPSNFYIVCQDCGVCLDRSNIQVIDFNYFQQC